jgi:Protein of unknown function (DUF3313)
MKTIQAARVLLTCTSLLTIAAVPAASRKDVEESMSADGLQKLDIKNVDVAYARPGVTIAPYSKLRIDPVQVAFRKDFDPYKPVSRRKLTTAELEGIRSSVGKQVHDEFVKELAKSSYTMVESAGPDVLQVRASIVDLYVNAPDVMEAGRSQTYTLSAGEMTLVMELLDSETGQVLARVYDKREARDNRTPTWTNSVTNQAETRLIANSWARILRMRLEAARGIDKQ